MTAVEMRARQTVLRDAIEDRKNVGEMAGVCFWLSEIAAQFAEFNERLGALTGGSIEKQWIRNKSE